jgi:uncharacterized protein (TIGR03118 family)
MLRTNRHPNRRFSTRPSFEVLEDRCLLSANVFNVLQTNLVSDLPGVAQLQDKNLVNPWGIAESSGSPFWISDNNSGMSTLYNVPGTNNTPVSINPLAVNIPTPVALTGGAPTGTVFNLDLAGGGFQIKGPNKMGQTIMAPAVFLFATEDGTIVGWNGGIDPTGKFSGPNGLSTQAVIAKDNSGNNFTEPDPLKQTGAVYKGLAIATSSTPIFANDADSTAVLYVANFRSGQIEVYDSKLKLVTSAEAFTDTKLPKGYAPFDVQVLNGQVYVTYALQNAAKHDDVAGHGHGFVDVFNLNGTPGLAGGKERLISRGNLDSPWGLAIAPPSFGPLAGDLLVGNFGNGRIHVYNATKPGQTTAIDTLTDPDGEPIQINGLWALRVGNGGAGGDANTVYFTAGLDDETHGLFGSLTPVAAGTPEGPAEAQKVMDALDIVQLDLTQVIQDMTPPLASADQLQQDLKTLRKAEAELAVVQDRFADDTHAGANAMGHAAVSKALKLHHDALDAVFAGPV